MSTRREAREWAVQLLFQLDMNPCDVEKALTDFWSDKETDERSREFMENIVRGVLLNIDKIDAKLKECAEHWDLPRMVVVDRNVMRIAIYEMLFCEEVPQVVSINEAVDIAKYFGSSESGKFVNGILDRVRKGLDRPAR